MKNEAKWHIQSLQAVFEDRVRLLKEQTVRSDDSVIKAQRQMGVEVRMGGIQYSIRHCSILYCLALHESILCYTILYCSASTCSHSPSACH